MQTLPIQLVHVNHTHYHRTKHTDSVPIWDSPYNGQVRLIGFNNHTMLSYGRVEVFQNGWWGTVCNEGFTQAGADSVCRQLGYTGATYSGDAL